MKPINPLSVHLTGIITKSDLRREVPKESPPPNRVVAGGLIRRKPIDRTARIVTAPANWMCKPMFQSTPIKTISNESELLRKELEKLNQSIHRMAKKARCQRDLIVSLVMANRIIMLEAESMSREILRLRGELRNKELLLNVL